MSVQQLTQKPSSHIGFVLKDHLKQLTLHQIERISHLMIDVRLRSGLYA